MSGSSPLVASGREDENTRPEALGRTSGPETLAAALGQSDRSGFVAALDAAVSTTSVEDDDEDEDA